MPNYSLSYDDAISASYENLPRYEKRSRPVRCSFVPSVRRAVCRSLRPKHPASSPKRRAA